MFVLRVGGHARVRRLSSRRTTWSASSKHSQNWKSPAVFLLDAGLNLNARGFRNLCEAEARVGFLKSIKFWCEIYPTLVRDEHLEFLAAIGPSYLGRRLAVARSRGSQGPRASV